MAAITEARKAYEESWKVLNKAQDANKARETELASLLRADYHLKLQQLAKSIGFTPAPAGHKYKVNDEVYIFHPDLRCEHPREEPRKDTPTARKQLAYIVRISKYEADSYVVEDQWSRLSASYKPDRMMPTGRNLPEDHPDRAIASHSDSE